MAIKHVSSQLHAIDLQATYIDKSSVDLFDIVLFERAEHPAEDLVGHGYNSSHAEDNRWFLVSHCDAVFLGCQLIDFWGPCDS